MLNFTVKPNERTALDLRPFGLGVVEIVAQGYGKGRVILGIKADERIRIYRPAIWQGIQAGEVAKVETAEYRQ